MKSSLSVYFGLDTCVNIINTVMGMRVIFANMSSKGGGLISRWLSYIFVIWLYLSLFLVVCINRVEKSGEFCSNLQSCRTVHDDLCRLAQGAARLVLSFCCNHLQKI